MIEYKNGTRKSIKQHYLQTRAYNIILKPAIYTFNIILYDCNNVTYNSTMVKSIYTYMYHEFFPHITSCSNHTVSKLDAFIYGPYNTLPCMTTSCTDRLLNSMEDRSMQLIDRQIYIPSIITVFITSHLCDYIAIADVQGNRIFINGIDHLFSKEILLHEWGHNLGLQHATTNRYEYGDTTCAMGRSIDKSLCFNAAHNHLLKWINVTSILTRKLKKCKKLKSLYPYVIDNIYYISYLTPSLLIHKIHDPDIGYTRLITRLKTIQKNYLFITPRINITWRYKNNYIHLNICKVN
jgi:hypothetical protein